MLDYQFMTTKNYRKQKKAFDLAWQQTTEQFYSHKDDICSEVEIMMKEDASKQKYAITFVNDQIFLYKDEQLVQGFVTHVDLLFYDGRLFNGVYQNGYYENGLLIFKDFQEDEDLYLFYDATSNKATLYYALHQTTNVKIHQFEDLTISNGGTIHRASIITQLKPDGQEYLWLRLLLDDIRNDETYTLNIRDLTFHPRRGLPLVENVTVQASFSFVATRKLLHETVHYEELLTAIRTYHAYSDEELAATPREEFELFDHIVNQFISLLHLQNIDERLERNLSGDLPLPLKLRSYLVCCLAVVTLSEKLQMRLDRVLHAHSDQ